MAEKKCEIECAQYSCRIIGYTALKEEQRLAISEFMSNRDVFAVLPTRYGKSMCFACLSKAYDKLRDTTGTIAVVVTPLDLVTIMESMVKQSCPQTIQTQAMLISESHLFLVIKIPALQ